MKNIIRVLMLVVLAVTFVGCSKAVTKTVSYQEATAKTAFKDAEPFAKETFPEAILVGFNNYDLTFDRTNLYPVEEDRDFSAKTPFWAFMFARGPEDIADGTLSDDEAFAVIFNAGELKLVDVGVVVTRDIDVPTDLSSDQWTADTDTVLEGVLAEIEAQGFEKPIIEHIDFNMNTGWDEPYGYEITIWTSSTTGYDSKVNGGSGEVGYTRAIEVF